MTFNEIVLQLTDVKGSDYIIIIVYNLIWKVLLEKYYNT